MSESIFKDADTPAELLGLLAGAASVCWSDIENAGEFQSDRASDLLDMALERLIELGWATGDETTEAQRLHDGVAAVIRGRNTGDFAPLLPKLRALIDDGNREKGR